MSFTPNVMSHSRYETANTTIKLQPRPMLPKSIRKKTVLSTPPARIAGLNLPHGERMLSMTRPVMGSLSASRMRSTDSVMLTAAKTHSGKLSTSDRKYKMVLASKE